MVPFAAPSGSACLRVMLMNLVALIGRSAMSLILCRQLLVFVLGCPLKWDRPYSIGAFTGRATGLRTNRNHARAVILGVVQS